MAVAKILIVIFLVVLVFGSGLCHVVPNNTQQQQPQQQSQQPQALNPSVITSLMIFSQQLTTMENIIKKQDKKIEDQDAEIATLEASINGKASQFAVHKLSSSLRNKFDLLRQDLLMRRRDIERYRNKMTMLESIMSSLESDYREIEMKADTVRDKFDNLSTKCRRVRTGWDHRANGEIMFLDRHYLLCRTDEFIHSFTLERRSDVPWSMVRYTYRCCRYNI